VVLQICILSIASNLVRAKPISLASTIPAGLVEPRLMPDATLGWKGKGNSR
jgi:hypothetical protein